MRILVLGKRGQLATALEERQSGTEEFATVFVGRPQIDLRDEKSIAAALDRHAPDVIVNTAAWTDVEGAESDPVGASLVNAVAPGLIAERARNARLIHLSTDFVFDGKKESPYEEGDETNPLSIYGKTKLAGETAVKQVDGDYLILRTAWLYSPFGRNFVRTMLHLASTQDRVDVVADQFGNPTSAEDVADAILAIVRQWATGSHAGLKETFHCAGSGVTSWAGLAEHIFAVNRSIGGPCARVRPVASADRPSKAPRPANSSLDSSKLAEHFGVRLPDWRHAVKKVVHRLLEADS